MTTFKTDGYSGLSYGPFPNIVNRLPVCLWTLPHMIHMPTFEDLTLGFIPEPPPSCNMFLYMLRRDQNIFRPIQKQPCAVFTLPFVIKEQSFTELGIRFATGYKVKEMDKNEESDAERLSDEKWPGKFCRWTHGHGFRPSFEVRPVRLGLPRRRVIDCQDMGHRLIVKLPVGVQCA